MSELNEAVERAITELRRLRPFGLGGSLKCDEFLSVLEAMLQKPEECDVASHRLGEPCPKCDKPNKEQLLTCECGRTSHIINTDKQTGRKYLTCKCGLFIEHNSEIELIKSWNRRQSAYSGCEKLRNEIIDKRIDNLITYITSLQNRRHTGKDTITIDRKIAEEWIKSPRGDVRTEDNLIKEIERTMGEDNG